MDIITEVGGHHPLTENAAKVLHERYLMKNKDGQVVETPTELFKRVADAIGKDAKQRDSFYELIASRKFLPNTPCLVNAGRPGSDGTFHACWVLNIADTLSNGKDGIYDSLAKAAKIFKGGGGVGYNFSNLRSAGNIVQSSKGVASGPVSFMRLFDASCGAIKQGGVRRGAQMAILDVHHPDIMDFITCKTKEGDISNFNISVNAHTWFMDKVINRDPDALVIWDAIIDGAWLNGEPGMVWQDNANADNPLLEILGPLVCTNPCGEVFLYPNEPCVLGSIDVAKFYTTKETHYARHYGKDDWRRNIDWDELSKTTRLATVFLDNMIDVSKYVDEDTENMSKSNRRIGLGVMGFAHLLYRLEIPYSSVEAIEIAEYIMSYINGHAGDESYSLATRFGEYPNSPNNKYRNVARTTIAPTGTISMIADTSSGIEPVFSLAFEKHVMADWKTGKKQDLLYIDPYFEKFLGPENFPTNLSHEHPIAKEAINRILKGETYLDLVKSKLIVVDNPYFETTRDISVEQHVRIQAAFQKHTDNGVSKTINLPNSATREDVAKAYMMAWELGCKGITVYRDGSRNEEVLTHGKKEEAVETISQMLDRVVPGNIPETSQTFLDTLLAQQKNDLHPAEAPYKNNKVIWNIQDNENDVKGIVSQIQNEQEWFNHLQKAHNESKCEGCTCNAEPIKLDGILPSTRIKKETGEGTLHAHVTELDGKPVELFTNLGKAGGCTSAWTEAVGRLVSMALQYHIPVEEVIRQLKGIQCGKPYGLGPNKVASCPDAIAQALATWVEQSYTVDEGSKYVPSPTSVIANELGVNEQLSSQACPECGSQSIFVSEGCETCVECGFSKC